MPPTSGALAVATVLFAFSLSVFVLIADDLLDGGGLISHDQAVLAWFVEVRTGAWVFVAKVVSALGSFVGLAILSLLLAFFVRARGWQWGLALAPLVSLLVASIASTGAKALFGRDRPPVTVHAVTVTSTAFPSGHATDAAACLLAGSFVLALTVAVRRSGQLAMASCRPCRSGSCRSQSSNTGGALALGRGRRLGARDSDRNHGRDGFVVLGNESAQVERCRCLVISVRLFGALLSSRGNAPQDRTRDRVVSPRHQSARTGKQTVPGGRPVARRRNALCLCRPETLELVCALDGRHPLMTKRRMKFGHGYGEVLIRKVPDCDNCDCASFKRPEHCGSARWTKVIADVGSVRRT